MSQISSGNAKRRVLVGRSHAQLTIKGPCRRLGPRLAPASAVRDVHSTANAEHRATRGNPSHPAAVRPACVTRVSPPAMLAILPSRCWRRSPSPRAQVHRLLGHPSTGNPAAAMAARRWPTRATAASRPDARPRYAFPTACWMCRRNEEGARRSRCHPMGTGWQSKSDSMRSACGRKGSRSSIRRRLSGGLTSCRWPPGARSATSRCFRRSFFDRIDRLWMEGGEG
jgi:hypothetical protein